VNGEASPCEDVVAIPQQIARVLIARSTLNWNQTQFDGIEPTIPRK